MRSVHTCYSASLANKETDHIQVFFLFFFLSLPGKCVQNRCAQIHAKPRSVLTVSPRCGVCSWARCGALGRDSPPWSRCRSTGPGRAVRPLRRTGPGPGPGPGQPPAAAARSPGSGRGQRGSELPPSLRQVGGQCETHRNAESVQGRQKKKINK